ncbi:hypothetical protein [Legionella drozanskii]|uniref:Uncharacterized protein n=1 Tax=Legionella drozanskii LLAP-1 TaxID=1212489 RepID=A0A0W0SWN1_9GAMM|nr:hypothetical protein [Legionella drozanskii]KTC87755.1 hypothetical protein Ldro_1374 [Legionella drozanskii LLAP-1]
MVRILSLPPLPEEKYGANEDFQFGYYECQNSPTPRKNAIVWQTLTTKELTPPGKTQQLAPQKIAHRLWTSHRLIDEEAKGMESKTGTSASTTIYDGKGNLITATVADASAFLVLYDNDGKPLGVRRLNSVIHRHDKPEESTSKRDGGSIAHKVTLPKYNPKIYSPAVLRSIGHNGFKKSAVCANSSIDIVNIAEAAQDLGIAQEKIGRIQVISVCYGFSDAAGKNNQTKEGNESHLLRVLNQLDSPGTKQESELARLLIEKAKPNTRENLSAAIQSINKDTPAFLLGLYGGQQEVLVSTLAAYFIGDFFKKQCNLNREAYATQQLSVNNNELEYKRDNPYSYDESEFKLIILKLFSITKIYQENLDQNTSTGKQIAPLLKQLLAILENSHETKKTKIEKFYHFLDSNHSETGLKNVEVIKQDDNVSALKFIFGIIFIIVSIITLGLPSLFVSEAVHLTTGRSPFDLFNTNGEQYAKELALVKTRKYEAFFKSAPPTENKQIDRQQQYRLDGPLLGV